jgi:hypothetical protein
MATEGPGPEAGTVGADLNASSWADEMVSTDFRAGACRPTFCAALPRCSLRGS